MVNVGLGNGMNKTVRWRQRFENFEKAYGLLARTVAIENPSEAERGGLIQFFEMAFELSWKLLKDYLEAEGYAVKSPRAVLKQAYQDRLIENGHVWMRALEDRNATVHLYDERQSLAIVDSIREYYFPAIKQLHAFFRKAYESCGSD